jgi:hypothetical protein
MFRWSPKNSSTPCTLTLGIQLDSNRYYDHKEVTDFMRLSHVTGHACCIAERRT